MKMLYQESQTENFYTNTKLVDEYTLNVLNSDLYGNILQYLNLNDAINFTTVSKELFYQSELYLGSTECIIGRLEIWRKRFPNAIYANIKDVTDEDFKYLKDIKKTLYK